MVNEVIRKIEEQQKKLKEGDIAFYVGEQLKDICRSVPEQAELILHDLDNPEMSIKKAEAKIAEYARNHKSGGCGCCPPQEADRILRDFYGLAPASVSSAPAEEKSEIIDLADFFA
jgi:hypothetical protein